MMRLDDKNLEMSCRDVPYKVGLKIGEQMKMFLLSNKNIKARGLAHNQVGGYRRVFLALINSKMKVFINPELVSLNGAVFGNLERCLSFPKKNQSNVVNRFENITIRHMVRARNHSDGRQMFIEETFTGEEAYTIQHELDHLNGIHIHHSNPKYIVKGGK